MNYNFKNGVPANVAECMNAIANAKPIAITRNEVNELIHIASDWQSTNHDNVDVSAEISLLYRIRSLIISIDVSGKEECHVQKE
jgi:hypothetical protein